MKRILGIDYGEVRTGLALSDPTLTLAGAFTTLKAYSEDRLLSLILETAKEHNVGLFVMGNPVNMNGTVGEKSLKVREFAKRLEEESKISVVLIDERMTTMQAHRYLSVTDTRGKKRKDTVDALSAEIILQTYLDSPACQKVKDCLKNT